MKKLTVLLFSILISFSSYGGIGDKYFCEEKESAIGYEKVNSLLTWNENSITYKSIPNESWGGVSTDTPFVINKNNYFVASSPYQEGHITYTFDGETFTSLFVRNSHTYFKEYICTKH
jgi:hypothetical protein